MRKFLPYLLLLISFVSKAQLSIDNATQTPAQLVVSSLVGSGVTPINIKFNGSVANASIISDQIGQFSTGVNPTNLGIDKGILLSTGDALGAYGPNFLGDWTYNSTNPKYGDVDLAALSGGVVMSAAILEFDFVATGPILKFDYVFGSDEYPEFVGSQYNDVFGFFLSGPGISGTFSNGAINIARIPSTNTSISINNVNNGDQNIGPCVNCEYYYNNTTSGDNASTWLGSTTQLDGFTTVLNASADLICGQIYHIKLAIANVQDDAIDSCVFLKNFTIPSLILTDLLGNQNVTQCRGDVTITSGLNATGNVFVWSLNGVVKPLLTTPTITVSEPGTYTLEVYSGQGCTPLVDDIIVTFLPDIDTIEPTDVYFCAKDITANINQINYMLNGLSAADYVFEFYQDNGGSLGALIPNANLSSYTPPNQPFPQKIWVTIQNVETTCKKTSSFKLFVKPVGPSGLNIVASEYFDDNLNITLYGVPEGNYEYQINGGAFQSNNFFNNLSAGEYQVAVRNDCGMFSDTVFLVSYPRYFTPNGDGYHDTWNIPFFKNQKDSKIHIFDRFGKLLKVISPNGQGWDGTYLGQPLPSTDYWFVIYYEEKNLQKTFKAHFSLKR
ncbi:MAG: choice-of-anchor L domain-containing protein [Limnohabitans sp.]|nr:choice-of-anchor L domain-containing protein [Limnohabitans sp.]